MTVRPRVIIVGDDSLPGALLVSRVEAALSVARPGEVMVQLRDRKRSARAVLVLGMALRAAAARAAAPFIVNDRLDLAHALDADGVHIGSRSVSVADARAWLGPDAIVSVACHTPDEVARAQAEGATLALLSPIFASPGKGKGIGAAAISRAVGLAPGFPVYALGGIDGRHVTACRDAGATGVAVIRAVVHAADGAEAMGRLLTPFR